MLVSHIKQGTIHDSSHLMQSLQFFIIEHLSSSKEHAHPNIAHSTNNIEQKFKT